MRGPGSRMNPGVFSHVARAFLRAVSPIGGTDNPVCAGRDMSRPYLPARVSMPQLIFLLAVWAAVQPVKSAQNSAEPGRHSDIVSIRLVPDSRTLWGKDSSQQFVVMARLADGGESDVTEQAQFSLLDAEVGAARSTGRVFAVGDGETKIRAVVGEHEARAIVRVEGSANERPFSFPRDIDGVFTRRGCNGSGCHGGVKGQAGFKLSNNGVNPHDDYKWIVEGGVFQVLRDESGGRKRPRVNLESPEQSLLLQKATMEVPHGGGSRFEKGSDDYKTILNWVRAGAPYGEGGEKEAPKLVRLEIFPQEVALDPGRKQRILVTAHFSDGRREDFTHQVLYQVNEAEIVNVSAEGIIEAVEPGETAILIKAAGRSARVGVGVVAPPLSEYPHVPRNNFIDEEVFSKLRKFNVVPSGLSSDAEFLRRVCLDLTGRLAPPERVRQFLTDKDPNKREKLIDILLDSPEYVDYWTFRFADLFRVAIFPVGINPKWTQSYWEWIRDAIARDRPYSEVAQERIAAQGYSAPSRHYLPYLVIPPPENMMGEEVRVFMGRRFDCAQCHDHPYEQWTQDQFWGMTAFFGPMFKLGGNPTSVIFDFPGGKEVAADVPSPRELRVIHPRTKQAVQPAFLDGTVIPFEQTDLPRRELAKWMTSHPFFAEATVNRMWSHFFGRGIVDPVDDFRSTNPPSHPELLRRLAEDFAENGYKLKRLIRLIVTSRTYQLSSATNETNTADRINYSHALPRPLDAEILLDAITEVTGVAERFDVGMDRGEWKGGKAPLGTRAVQLKESDIYYSPFLDLYGRPNRFSVPERDATPKLTQALHMLAGSTYNEKLWQEGGRVYEMHQQGASDDEIIEELYLAALSRFPTKQETAALRKLIAQTPTREQALQDLQWAIISSREFVENH